LDVNLNGTFFAMHHALAQMALQGSGGSVVNLSSIAGLRGLRNTAPSSSPYAA
jgi:NAD(P)-dependent dehydrogenase (short-subunit alcohol dehydrogenase family)